MTRRAIAFTLTFLFANTFTLSAAVLQDTTATATARPISDAIATAALDAEAPVSLWSLSQTPKRPALLPVLYGTYAGLQALDVVSTRKALAAGASETNPFMNPRNMGATIAVKAASGIATFYVVEKTWKKHRVGAVVLMAIMNGTSVAIVARNNRNASRR
jgi:hypothetical protein